MKKPQNCLTVWGFKVSRPVLWSVGCGKTGIRTLGTRKGTTVFETAPIDHSGIFPRVCGCKFNCFFWFDKIYAYLIFALIFAVFLRWPVGGGWWLVPGWLRPGANQATMARRAVQPWVWFRKSSVSNVLPLWPLSTRNVLTWDISSTAELIPLIRKEKSSRQPIIMRANMISVLMIVDISLWFVSFWVQS